MRSPFKLIFYVVLLSIFSGCQYDAIPPLKESTWDLVPLNYPSDNFSLIDIYFSDASTGYVLGKSYGFKGTYLLFKTLDGGITWKEDTLRTKDFYWGKIIGQWNGFLYLSGKNETHRCCDLEWDSLFVFKSKDGGASWEDDSFLGYPYQQDYLIDDNNRLRFTNNQILKSDDRGRTWKPAYSDFIGASDSHINFMSSSTGYIYGDYYYSGWKSFVLKTNDGGSSWHNFNVNPWGISSAYFLDSLKGFRFSLQSELFKTINGGIDWFKVNSSLPSLGPVQSYFASEKEGYYAEITAGAASIYHTTDGGATWKIQYGRGAESIRKIYFFSPTKAFAIVAKTTIVKGREIYGDYILKLTMN